MGIEVREIASGFAVKFPFALKDGFREAFPSAKWSSYAKEWTVGPRSGKRLTQWADAVKASGVVEALESQETREFEEKELAKLKERLAETKDKIAAAEEEKVSAQRRAANISKIREELEARETDLARVEAERDAAQAEREKERLALRAQAARFADVDAVPGLVKQMLAAFGDYHRKDEFHECQAQLRKVQDELAEVGLESALVDHAVGANFNRPDRDKRPMAITELNFSRL